MTDHDPAHVPTEDPRPDELRRAPSLVVVNTGPGKGKTTAAMGIVMRGVARGWPVGVVQFLKSGTWRTGEEKVCRQLGVDWWAEGEGFTWLSEDLSVDEAVAAGAWDRARNLIGAGDHRLVVLDEITYPINWEWIAVEEVVATIGSRPDHVNVVLTGRNAPPELIEVADTVSEVVPIKHAYEAGIRAKKGIDF
ncbi:MAG: cob(I)yrinic acid a,c-diamide adenosyltransferase [Acidimicrobiales bacterium]